MFDCIFAGLAAEGPKPERIMIAQTHVLATWVRTFRAKALGIPLRWYLGARLALRCATLDQPLPAAEDELQVGLGLAHETDARAVALDLQADDDFLPRRFLPRSQQLAQRLLRAARTGLRCYPITLRLWS